MQTMEIGKRIALSNILFATDFSACSDAALPYALAIARKYGAKVYGSHVVSSDDYLFTAPDVWPAHLQEDEQLQEEVTGRLEKQLGDIPHKALVGVGDVWEVLRRQIDENAIDLLVVGTHGRTGTSKLFAGSIAEKIFRQADCPVLSVGPNVPRKADGEIEFQHLLLATDFGKQSMAALPFTLSLAEEGQAHLTLLHIAELPMKGTANFESLRFSLNERLKDLVPVAAEPWCQVECLVEFRRTFVSPAEQILEVAKDRAADLIVVGVRPVHGSVGAVTHMAHTTDQHIVAHATCPVLTVRG